MASETVPEESLAAKIYILVRAGHRTVQQLLVAVGMIRHVKGTTLTAEQLHGQGPALHRLHKRYGASLLIARILLSILRPLFPGCVDEDEKAIPAMKS